MKNLTEQEQKRRQQKAYENRDAIRPGDWAYMVCSRADDKRVFFSLSSGTLVTKQPEEKIKAGDPVKLTCTAVITKSNGYGPFVDYQFRVCATGVTVTINGPDAQALTHQRTTTAVQNRDIPFLAGTMSALQAISQTEQRIAQMRDGISHITQTITGVPGGRGAKGLDDLFAELSELEDTLKQEGKDYLHRVKEAQKILDGISSPSMRTFVVMKYVMFVPNEEIRSGLNMTRRSFERAVKSIEGAADMKSVLWQERYIKKSG